MASFSMLPNELLESVVGHLLDRKLDDFDIVATRDLQNVRLVCRTLHTIATPILFENMVLDLKMWETGDLGMRRLVTFSTKHPDLAKLVHRLQLQVPPVVQWWTPRDHHNRLDTESVLDYQMTHNGWTSEQVAIIHDILVPPLQKWRSLQDDAFSFQLLNSGNSIHSASAAIFNTFGILPNLHHVEHALSTQYTRTFSKLESNVLGITGLSVSHELLADISTRLSFVEGCRLIVGSLETPITSLKLRNVPVCRHPYHGGQIFPATLRHLELEIYDQDMWDDRSEPVGPAFMDVWRSSLAPLEQLRTLRLGWGTEYDLPLNPFYIDDLLIDPKDGTNVSLFPHLKSLTLVDCSLRLHGFLAFAASHASTLTEFELNRVTFDPSYCPQSWSEIGALCKSTLPNLVYLRFAKLVTHFPKRADAPLDELPVPERWNPGLESVTGYEWRKGVDGSDVEVIGSKCPWKAEDIIIEDDCRRHFNGDRYWFSVEKERILRAW